MTTDDENESIENDIKERFDEVDGGGAISDDGLIVKYCFRTLSKYPIIYGCKRYSSGTHDIHFQIEKRSDLRFFFGIISSLDKVYRNRISLTDIDNKSLYGWWGLNTLVTNGEIQRTKHKNDIDKTDELTLILKCDQHKIQLEHHRTKTIRELSIDLTTCPFPWKMVVELPSYNDSVRIIR